MGYKLFLDDARNPVHCVTYMHSRIGRKNFIYLENEWVICRNYTSFVNTIKSMGLPKFISFDHDLGKDQYGHTQSQEGWEEYHTDDQREETGYDCAKWLVGYCMDHKLALPEIAVHSMNSVGTANIISYLKQAEKWIQGKS